MIKRPDAGMQNTLRLTTISQLANNSPVFRMLDWRIKFDVQPATLRVIRNQISKFDEDVTMLIPIMERDAPLVEGAAIDGSLRGAEMEFRAGQPAYITCPFDVKGSLCVLQIGFDYPKPPTT